MISSVSMRALAWPLAAALAACSAPAARPLDPARSAATLRARSLSDPLLAAWVREHAPEAAGEWPPAVWDLTSLTLVGFYFQPELAAARARVAEAEGRVVTAGTRPNPTLRAELEHSDDPTEPESPWSVGGALDVALDPSGHRAHERRAASALAAAERLALAQSAWDVRRRVRDALVQSLLASREVELRRAESEVLDESARLLEQRVAAGSVSRPDLDAAKIEALSARQSLAEAEIAADVGRAELARALGLPPEALAGQSFGLADLEQPPALPGPDCGSLLDLALIDRLDVRATLHRYDAAEEELAAAAAQRFPDLEVSPGYRFDQGQHKFSFGVAAPLPIFNQNEGPIAEALARRSEAEADVVAAQARVLAETTTAWSRYRGELTLLEEAGEQAELARVQLEAQQRLVALGGSDRLVLAGLRRQELVARRLQLETLREARAAFGALEDSVQRPLPAGAPPEEWPLGDGAPSVADGAESAP